jgi:hypothetical protein
MKTAFLLPTAFAALIIGTLFAGHVASEMHTQRAAAAYLQQTAN